MGKDSRRETVNNFNPYNRLKLNQFHQQQEAVQSEGKKLRKKQRDLERLINHDGIDGEVKEKKEKQLKQVQETLQSRKKSYERQKRKQFFIQKKYGPIMQVETTKILRLIKKNKNQQQSEPDNKQLSSQAQELQKKLRYVKNYPKDLKYISLFPNNKLTEEAQNYQNSIMQKIQRNFQKQQRQKNATYRQRGTTKDDKKIQKDDFFIVE